MSKSEKLLVKLKRARGSFKWSELTAVLLHLGFQKIEAEGSRVTFTNGSVFIKCHRPHPQKEVKSYAIKQVKDILESEGLL